MPISRGLVKKQYGQSILWDTTQLLLEHEENENTLHAYRMMESQWRDTHTHTQKHKILITPNDMQGEGNGTPLQYSCLENPMDGRAWWAAVHGVTESQT